MDRSNKKVCLFETPESFKAWVNSQEWYQTIELLDGFYTAGKFPTENRLPWFDKYEFSGKTVLDIGCNSGQYSLYAKKRGASRVIGIDLDEARIYQAKTLAMNERADVEFYVHGLDNIEELGVFDITICIAVVTEVENVLGALRKIRDATGVMAIIEMGLARPLFNVSRSKRWLKSDKSVSRRGRVSEMYRHKHAGWVMFPSLEIVKDIFGNEFDVQCEGRGLRYEKVVAYRR